MTITVPVKIDNIKIRNFTEAEQEVYRIALEFGRALMRYILETRDLQILSEREAGRYRNKGLRNTCIAVVCVSYNRIRSSFLSVACRSGCSSWRRMDWRRKTNLCLENATDVRCRVRASAQYFNNQLQWDSPNSFHIQPVKRTFPVKIWPRWAHHSTD